MRMTMPNRVATCLALCLALLGLTARAVAQKLPKIKQIEGEPVRRVLAKDGIPAIDKPRFVAAGKVKFLSDGDPVIGVFRNGVAKAYSVWHLDSHEIVNDVFGEDPVMVTW